MSNFNKLVEDVFTFSLEAYEKIRSFIRETPIEQSTTFSRIGGCNVYLKYENLQKTGSFKVRGALYKVFKVKDDAKGVVAASAGNHAQGVAFAAKMYGLKSIIVMPETASISKINATRGYGAEVLLYGRVYDDAEKKAKEISREKGYEYIPPFDDIHVIAGQATIAHEITKQLNPEEIDKIIVPIGGGGLIAGLAVVFKKINPKIKIIGVEPENSPKTVKALKFGRPIKTDVKPSIADGLTVKKLGKITFQIIRRLVDSVVLVNEDELAQSIYLLLERAKVLAEGAGAASLSAIISHKIRCKKNENIVSIISGGNIDLNNIYRLLLRGLARSGRIATIYGYAPDVPGTLAKITGIIASFRGNIIEVIHERADTRVPAWHTSLRIIIEVPSQEALERIVEALNKEGFSFSISD